MEMTKTPNLGTNWKEAVQSAYAHGYNAFQHYHPGNDGPVAKALEIKEESGMSDAVHFLMNDTAGQTIVSEATANKRLWWAIDDFYAAHMPDEAYEQLQREAAVAEDLDAAYEAGAYDALLGEDYDVSEVSHMHDGDE